MGSNYIQSHILHFFHLAALDYVKTDGTVAAAAPFLTKWTKDFRADAATSKVAVDGYLEALNMRRLAHEMTALWGGRMPHNQSIVVGGTCEVPTFDKVVSFLKRLEELETFINGTYKTILLVVAGAYKDYWDIGAGCKNMLAYGAFPLKSDKTSHVEREKLYKSGTIIQGNAQAFNPDLITEEIKYSWYERDTEDKSGKPLVDVIKAVTHKEKKDAYSFVKAPRYNQLPMEVGPLARQLVTQDKAWTDLIGTLNLKPEQAYSVLGRHAARLVECLQLVAAMKDWAMQLKPGEPVTTAHKIPDKALGMGLTEAARGSLGHWQAIEHGRTKVYNAIVPSTWNMSPRDDNNIPGPLEQSLIGAPCADANEPIEAVRIIRSYDPCLACAIHVVTPNKKTVAKFVIG